MGGRRHLRAAPSRCGAGIAQACGHPWARAASRLVAAAVKAVFRGVCPRCVDAWPPHGGGLHFKVAVMLATMSWVWLGRGPRADHRGPCGRGEGSQPDCP